MKHFNLSLSRLEASEKLKGSLRIVASSALRCDDHLACYGNVYYYDNKTEFKVGLGPTDLTTAVGYIYQIDEANSYLEYEFRGPFWSFIKRNMIRMHFDEVFDKYKRVSKNSE